MDIVLIKLCDTLLYIDSIMPPPSYLCFYLFKMTWGVLENSFQMFFLFLDRSSRRSCSVKKVFLEISQNSQENTCARDSFFNKVAGQACNFIKKDSVVQVFSCEFCEISKNAFFIEHLRATASVWSNTSSD